MAASESDSAPSAAPPRYNPSSPVKASRPVKSRQDLENTLRIEKRVSTDRHFVKNHLSAIPEGCGWEDCVDYDLLSKITGPERHQTEHKLYPPFSKFLNKLIKVFDKYIPVDDIKPVVFIPNGNKKMTNHPAGPDSQSHWAPDIIGVTGPLNEWVSSKGIPEEDTTHQNQDTTANEPKYRTVPYPMARALIELKMPDYLGLNQGVTYAWYTLEASPNICGVYVLAARPQDYQIAWVNASGATSSPRFDWGNLEPLARYLYSLYVPPAGHFLNDPTVSVNLNVPTSGDICWAVKVGEKLYQRCTITFWSGAWGRRTTVFETYPPFPTINTVIKESYRDDSRRYKEIDLLDHIHASGIVPGVVDVIAAEDVSVGGMPLTTTGTPDMGRRVIKRTKTRIAMGTHGMRLRQAQYLSHLLKAIYDAVETHRIVVVERKVLHRDMSGNNILMYPAHNQIVKASAARPFIKPTRPVAFIDDILDGAVDVSTKITMDRARCLLIDFDNAALTEPIPPTSETTDDEPLTVDAAVIGKELAERTGTARYIARAVAKSRPLPAKLNGALKFVPMPSLTGKALELYTRAYGQDQYEMFSDRDGKFHGGLPPSSPSGTLRTDIAFSHRPTHDVESIFWTLMVTLLLALPAESREVEEFRYPAKDARRWLIDHNITDEEDDRRGPMLKWDDDEFEFALHPGLREVGLGQLLVELARQVRPEYMYLEPRPHQDHLHEAFRRILLDYIVKMPKSSDVKLDTSASRVIIDDEDKRKAETVLWMPAAKRSRFSALDGSSRVICTSARTLSKATKKLPTVSEGNPATF